MANPKGNSVVTVVLVGLAGAVVLGSTAIVGPARRTLPVVVPEAPVEVEHGDALPPGPRRVAVVPEPPSDARSEPTADGPDAGPPAGVEPAGDDAPETAVPPGSDEPSGSDA